MTHIGCPSLVKPYHCHPTCLSPVNPFTSEVAFEGSLDSKSKPGCSRRLEVHFSRSSRDLDPLLTSLLQIVWIQKGVISTPVVESFFIRQEIPFFWITFVHFQISLESLLGLMGYILWPICAPASVLPLLFRPETIYAFPLLFSVWEPLEL